MTMAEANWNESEPLSRRAIIEAQKWFSMMRHPHPEDEAALAEFQAAFDRIREREVIATREASQ